ncbi:MAG: secretin N-terminal domain-containing protein, partial [bacterium]
MANIRWVRASMVVVLAGCASGGSAARPVRSSVRVEPQNANSPSNANAPVDPAAAMSLPQLPSSRQPAMSQAPERRIKLLEVQPGTPIAKAVEQVASLLGLGVSVDPEVRGTTSGVLRNVTLDSALAELVGRQGYAYQVQGTVLRVVPIKMQTRTFSLDYVALSRVGTMSTVVQRRLSNNFAGGGMQAGLASGFNGQGNGIANGAGSGADVLTAQSVADIWQEIRVAISGILQAGQATRAAQTEQSSAAGNTGNAGGSSASGNGATSVAFSDGSTVVVSPISGLISVTAMPEKLRAVEAFIDDFQASVLRQVSIEAKIVEVNLNNTFQFGIDWSTITTAGSHSFSLRTDPTVQTTGNAGNINFVLNDGTTSINAVLPALTSQGTINVLSNERT